VEASHLAWRVIRLDETTSTNTVALEAAADGEPEGLVVVADHQTAGRGRLQRTWVAPPGSALLVSILLRPPPDALHLAPTAVGCAAAAACGVVAGFEPGLKWPNDLVAGGRKLGGILAEAAASSGNVTAVVVGLGLNVHRPADRPPDVERIATDLDRWATTPIGRAALLDCLLDELATRYPLQREQLAAEHRRRCVTLGRRVAVQQPTGTVVGTAVDVDADGRLWVETGSGSTVRIEVGDVVHLRPA
jgi:BirA family biotin operon repressor/biotin-[acetyl-CoA-carboxylase] ligase